MSRVLFVNFMNGLNGTGAPGGASYGRLAPLLRSFVVGLFLVTPALLAAPPDEPAADAKAARERAQVRVAEALEEVRQLSERTPKLREKKLCALLERTEAWLHVPGKTPQRTMTVAAALSAAADALDWEWSHALPAPVLYMDLDFGPARRRLSGAEWLCSLDRLTGGLLRLQMYPRSKHLFAAQRIFADEDTAEAE